MQLLDFIEDTKDKTFVFFGEHHGKHVSFYKDLNKYIDIFDGIFVEFPSDHQSSVDHFIRTGKFDNRLQSFLQGGLAEGKDQIETFKTIFNYGKTIRVVCIDSCKSVDGSYIVEGESRDDDMFNNVLRAYKPNQRWLCIVGSRHLTLSQQGNDIDKSLGEKMKDHFGNELTRVSLITNQESVEKVTAPTYYPVDRSTLPSQSYLAQFDAYIITP